jgi:hypothetical protein
MAPNKARIAGENPSSHTMSFISLKNALGVLILVLTASPAWCSTDSNPLQSGYREMYNLDFTAAHKTFESWEQTHPNDPMGPVSNAAAYLFSEFERLHILETELFTDDTKFIQREKQTPDPDLKRAFEAELGKGGNIARDVLAKSPQDPNAQFAQIMTNGLRGDYASLIEKRNVAALAFTKAGRNLAERLITQDPSYYDAYLAIGIENYILSANSAPVRWILRLGGAQTDKDAGIKNLQITATKGMYLAPFARMLLAVAALRDKDHATAKTLLSGLSQDFPQNALYKRELSRIQ